MNDNLRLSEEGAGLVKAFEGCLKPIGGGRFKPYVCPAGVLTIGWGHTNAHGRKFDSRSVWYQHECDEAFEEDMERLEAAVKRLVKVKLTQFQFDALVSFAYNCGEGNLQKSTLLRKLNRGDFDGAAREFAKWNRGDGKVLPGLVRRRASEALLFQGIPDANYDGKPDHSHKPARIVAEPMPQAVDTPEEKPITSSKIGNTSAGIGAVEAADAGTQVKDAIDKASEYGSSISTAKETAEQLGLWDVASTLLTDPRFLVTVAIVVACAAIWFWRWKKAKGAE